MEEEIKILQKAIGIEEFGFYYYKKLERAVENQEGKSLLVFLANAEKEHREILEKMIREYDVSPQRTPIDKLVDDIIMNPGIQKVFTDLMQKSILDEVDAIEAVRLGIDVEKKSIEFYSKNAHSVVKPKMAELFANLTEMEEGHLKILEENLNNLQNEGTWYGYVPILEG
jgi:rubrerythrin